MSANRTGAEVRGAQQLVMVADPQGSAAEAYRTLRTNLRFTSFAQPVKTILVTSPGEDEGKSTTIANLGIAAAQSGLRVALLDCDLRRPSLDQIFDVPNTLGLTSLFLGETLEDLPLHQTQVPGPSVLPSGPKPPNPADLLASSRLDGVIAALLESFDLILMDAPPVTIVADASILAPRVDGVLLVVDARRTHQELAQKAKAQLERVHAHIIGVVLNNAPSDRKRYG